MENFYLIIVIILFILAISDLIVGVSNDAVNFLNSAIGSKAAPMAVILITATAGILIGATFSDGMMEVARNGIFNPAAFSFSDIIIICLAVMITDVLLLDLFNTFGLPTSTTVSVVFELLGASVGMAVVKIRSSGKSLNEMGEFINSDRILLIISGILLSVVISFVIGIVVQYISRIIFSFNYRRSVRYFGSLWGGIAIASITYFLLIKGAKGSSIINAEQIAWISGHSTLILGFCFAGSAILLQLLQWISNINIFKVIVLFGTFALAMSFAGNDLVNFIGVPLAGYESYKIFMAQHALNAGSFTLSALTEEVKTPAFFLLIAGMVMALTLWFSRKARTVTRTEVDLGNQDLVYERFSSSALSRSIVRIGIFIGNFMNQLLPVKFRCMLSKRFDDKSFKKNQKKNKGMSFDLLRASVNLAVSSSLIAFATSYKLPLSTTYVTFMVAMSTSLADKAWGRESAVYRVSGVIAVIGGWFFTAFIAFTGALCLALFIHMGGPFAVIALIILSVLFIYRTHVVHTKRERLLTANAELDTAFSGEGKSVPVLNHFNNRIANAIESLSDLYKSLIESMIAAKRKKLARTGRELAMLQKDMKSFKKNIYGKFNMLHEKDLDSWSEYFIQMCDYVGDIIQVQVNITDPVYNHIDNNHEPLHSSDADDLTVFQKSFISYLNEAGKFISDKQTYGIEDLNVTLQDLLDKLTEMRRTHLERVKTYSIGTRVSILYLDMLSTSRNLALSVQKLANTAYEFSGSPFERIHV